MGPLLGALALLAIGSSLVRPPIFGLISQWTPDADQGVTIGVAQSSASLARIVGPLMAAVLFKVNPATPYLLCGVIAFVAAVGSHFALRGQGAAEAGASSSVKKAPTGD